jgi:hypothetical protein
MLLFENALSPSRFKSKKAYKNDFKMNGGG